MNNKQVTDFLRDLTALSNKYGIYIHGCGCCGSPFLQPLIDAKKSERYQVDMNYKNLWFTESTSPIFGEDKTIVEE